MKDAPVGNGLDAAGTDLLIVTGAERLPDGTRTFRIIEGDPLQTSYGEDLYEKVFRSEVPATVPEPETALAD